MTILYQSNTGYSRQYAEMLGRATKLHVYDLDEAAEKLESGAQVVFLGGLMAGHIHGIDRAVKRYKVKAACAVGMKPPGKGVLAELSKANYVPDAPIFYLQGGYDPKKVGWLKRRMVNMATKSMRENLQQKPNRTAQEQAQLDMLLHGGSFVAYENLSSVIHWMQENLERF